MGRLVDNIWMRFKNRYPFLTSNEEIDTVMKRYILECCSSCFHFGAHSLSNDKSYGLYPLSFIRRDAECMAMDDLKMDISSEELVQFERMKVGDDYGKESSLMSMLRFGGEWHQKEMSSGDYDGTREPRICFFTWPAIVEIKKRTLIETNATTKIWVQLNDDLYEQMYGEDRH